MSPSPIEKVRRRVYPEVHAGGFADNDGSLLFYSRVQALLEPGMTVLDYGAGRGAAPMTDPCEYRRGLRSLRGKVARVVGCDVDSVVLENPFLDEAHVFDPMERLPFEDDTFDLIVSDFVFEHVANPAQVAAELNRVLAPGGWILARTPNLFGYVAVATRLTPPFLRNFVLRLTNPNAGGKDNFPVKLRMNTKRAIRRLFPARCFDNYSYVRRFEGLGYFGRSALLVRLVKACMHFLPIGLGPEIIIVLRKHGAPTSEAQTPSPDVDEVPSLIEEPPVREPVA